MTTLDEAVHIAEYERLRHKAVELDKQANVVDARLIELEEELLPDSYTYPGDSPLDDEIKTNPS